MTVYTRIGSPVGELIGYGETTTDGSMRGCAGGVERKVQLLAHEGAIAPMLA
ncbi:MAG: hypothetical protein ACRDSS_07360 [Actinocrinis sp.]